MKNSLTQICPFCVQVNQIHLIRVYLMSLKMIVWGEPSMNREDELNVLWAKKTALQRLLVADRKDVTFVCPICNGTAQVKGCNEGGYEFSCEHHCFYDRRK